MKYFKTNFILIFCLFFSPLYLAQKTDSVKTYKLEDVVVSATRTNSSTLELANSITIIDSAEIADLNKTNVFELLKTEYGLSFTQQGGAGTLSNIYIRGSNSSHTLVLIDGVEVNLPSDPANVYDFSLLPAENIDRIEILRGPQSTLYGSDALAGVVNIITKKGMGSPKLLLSAEAGSFNTLNTSANVNGSFNKFHYSLSWNKASSDGFSAASEKYGNTENDGYRRDNLSSVLGYNFNDDLRLNFFARYSKSKSDYDQSGIYGDDPTYIFDQEEFSLKSEGISEHFDGKLTNKIGISMFRNIRKYSYDASAASFYSSRSLYDGKKYKIDWQSDIKLPLNNLVTVGFEIEREEASSEYLAFTDLRPPDYESIFLNRNSVTAGIFIQDQIKLNDNIFNSVGIRYDHHDKFGSAFTYRFAPTFIIWQTNTKLKATVGKGFKAPSLFYLYDPSFGNELLKPEKNVGWDAGFEQFFWDKGLSFGATYFENYYKDLFGFDENYKTINISKAKTNGFELYSTVKPTPDLKAKLNYTYTDALDQTEGLNSEDRKLIRRPEHKFGGYFSYHFSDKTDANVEIVYVGRRDDLDFSTYPSTRIHLDPYVLVNVAAHYNLFEFLKLHLRVDNLLDSDYEEVFGYGTAGLSVYGGFGLSIN